MSELALQITNQRENIASSDPVLHFDHNAMCMTLDTSTVKEEKEEKNDISSIIVRSLQSVEDDAYAAPQLLVEKNQEIKMEQAVMNCLQTLGDRTSPDMDIVIQEVHIMEEVEWQREEVSLQSQQEQLQVLFGQLCRVCALETHNLVSVFEEEGIKLQLAEKIHWHLPIEVKEDDKLPVTMCSSCISKLNSCHELAMSCLEANEKLQKMFNVTVADVNNSTSLLAMQKSSKRPTFPNHRLSKAMELLKKAKEVPGRHLRKRKPKSVNNDHQSSFLFCDGEYGEIQESDDDNYTDSDDTKQNNVVAGDNTLTEFVKSNTSEMFGACLPNGYSRPQRLIKKRDFREYDSSLKSKIVGVMQDIMKKEDEGENIEVTERKRSIRHREWKCETCGYVLPRKSALIMHQQRKHGPQNFSCNYCDKTFRNTLAMRIHERSHTKVAAERIEPTTYICEFCGKSFRGKKTLKEHHLAIHSNEKPFKCDKCDRNYGSLASLDIHKATHSTETPFLCDLCGKSFKHVSNLRSHKRSHMDNSDKNRQVCDVCGKGFRSRFHLSEHMNVHTGRRPYACNVCGKNFHKKIQLRQHGSAHSGMQPFKCHLCGVRFNRRGNMTQHIKRHDRERKYTCRVCSEGFATLGGVLSHRKRHTKEEVENSIRQQTGTTEDPEQVAYKCEVCGKLLAKKESLTIHMRSHTGEKPFECGICGKRLSNKGSLSYHMRSFHTGERPHTCQYCGEGFLSREARLVHERIHTGEKPYICSICNMGFRCSSNLAQHSRVHSEARPHPCPHCDKRFQRKGALDVHIRTHTGERPYGCDLCGRRFTQKNDMLKHRRTHSPVRPCPCPQCGQTFSQKRDLAKHQLLHIAVQQDVEQSPATQTVLITTADNLITYPEIHVPVMENTQTLILHRY